MHLPRPNEGQVSILHCWNQGSSSDGLVLRDYCFRLLGLYIGSPNTLASYPQRLFS